MRLKNSRHAMAILNVTPDSFFESSCDEATIMESVRGAIAEGATIIDVGGYSSRPGAAEVTLEQEWERVERGVGLVREVDRDVSISVDTSRSEVVRRAAGLLGGAGSFIVNDITAGEVACGGDDDMIATVAALRLPYIAMYMRGTPQTMQMMTNYDDDGGVVEAALDFFRGKIVQCREAGVEELILDPGFGFAKSLEQNYELLKSLDRVSELGCPVLVGVSRKSMIYKVLDCEPSGALSGTIALGWEALAKGAKILRVHDVREATDTIKIFEKYNLGR